MPYKSAKQRAYLHAKEPELARKWDKKYGGKVEKAKEPIFKADNPDFNHKAAKEAFDLVMKMDDDSAEMFVHKVTSEVLEETISKNLRTLQAHLDKVAKRRLERVTKMVVSKALTDKRWEPYAEAVVEIAKGPKHNPYGYGYVFQESDFNRDPTTGQFRAKITHNQTKPLHKETAETLGIRGMDKDNYKNLKNPRLEAQYQDEYRQLAQFLRNVHQSTQNPGDTDVFLHFRAKDSKGRTNPNGQIWVERQTGTKVEGKKLDPSSHDLIGVEARPANLRLGGAAFGLTTALGGNGMSDRMVNTERGLNYLDRELRNDFADDWMRAADPMNPNLRTYSRVKQGSKLVGAFAPPGSKLALASEFGQLVGDHGPEAEKVFGPSTRKAAYRYRGVTKKPDEALVSRYGAALRRAKSQNLAQESDEARTRRKTAQTRALNAYRNAEADRLGKPVESIRIPEKKRVEIMNRATAEVATRTGFNEEEMVHGRNEVLRYLYLDKENKRKPEARLYNLQLAAGNTPPSEGVIIDKNGKIVAQAVGYGDDHYLPFNLKNLKGLRGGEYIRTRSVGGPTSEDIYTGLMTGAKKLTVVSRSGTFTVNFESDFKGGRRYNDKALRMTRRYQQLLDAVQSEQVDKQTLSPAIKNGIIEEIRREWPGESPKVIAEKVKAREEEFKSYPELSSKDQKLADFMALQRKELQPSRDAQDLMREVTNEIAQEKEFKFRLNGPGYAAALDALREQFPYYITIDYLTDRENEENLQRDRGYVEPGRIRPTEAQGAGLYGTALNQGLKRKGLAESSASRMYYQNKRGQHRAGVEWQKPKAEESEGTEGEETGEDGKPKTREEKVKDAIAAARERRAHAQMGVDLYDAIKEASINPGDLSILKLGRTEFQSKITTVEGVEEMKEVITALEKKDVWDKLPQKVKTAVQQYKRGAGDVEAKEFEKELALQWPTKPFTFNMLSAYKDKDTPEQKELRILEVKRINERAKSIRYGVPLSELDEAQMATEIADLKEAYQILKDNPEMVGDTDAAADLRKAIRESFLKESDPEAANRLLQGGPDRLLTHMTDVHKMRRLKQLGGWTPEEVAPGAPASGEATPEQKKTDIFRQVSENEKRKHDFNVTLKGVRRWLDQTPNEIDLNTDEENLLVFLEDLENLDLDQVEPHSMKEKHDELLELDLIARRSRDRRPWEQT